MSTKTLHFGEMLNTCRDDKISDLARKAMKYDQLGKSAEDNNKFTLSAEHLVSIPIPNNKITHKTLNHIVEYNRFSNNKKHYIPNILTAPFDFLNEHNQLLSFNQVMAIIDTTNSHADETFIKYTSLQVKLAWIYHYFYKKECQFYVPKYKLMNELNKTTWKKYNIHKKDFEALLVDIDNTFYTTNQFIELEKSTGDEVLEHFYIDEQEVVHTVYDEYLTTEQNDAVHNAIIYPLSCITGFPGTGKSTIIKTIVDYYETKDTYCWLLAPTGKAIKDLKDKCNKRHDTFAGTIHRFVYALYPQFKNKSMCEDSKKIKEFLSKFPNPFQVFIVDEASMISFDLFNRLLHIIIQNKGKLVLVGDRNQLPPIQVGRPFECILHANIFPTTFLTEIKRTDKQILMRNIKKCTYSHLQLSDFDDAEMIFIHESEFSDTNLTNHFQYVYSNYGEFKVITPQHKFDGGVEQCNRLLQRLFNSKHKKVCDYFNTSFYVNDIIIQKDNDYTRTPPRVNGDVAQIIGLDITNLNYKQIRKKDINCKIKYLDDGEERTISTSELTDEFGLFYSATVHKFQGSQENTCVVLLSSQHSMWSSENNKKLFYTAISRAQQRCIIIGDKNILEKIKVNRKDKFHSKFMKEFYMYD